MALINFILTVIAMIIAYKIAPKHPKKTGRRGSDVSLIDYLLGNWDPDVEDDNYKEDE